VGEYFWGAGNYSALGAGQLIPGGMVGYQTAGNGIVH